MLEKVEINKVDVDAELVKMNEEQVNFLIKALRSHKDDRFKILFKAKIQRREGLKIGQREFALKNVLR